MARGTVIALHEHELMLVSEHTRSSYMPGMLLGSWVEKSRVATFAGLGIQVEHAALLVDEEHVVPRQSLHPQVPVVVDRILSMVVCSFCLPNEIDIQIHIIQSNL